MPSQNRRPVSIIDCPLPYDIAVSILIITFMLTCAVLVVAWMPFALMGSFTFSWSLLLPRVTTSVAMLVATFLAVAWFEEATGCRRWVMFHLDKADNALLFSSEAMLRKSATKHFIEIRRTENLLLEEWEKRGGHPERYINYLHRHPDVGQPIFRYLNEPKNLVVAARDVDTETSWEDYRKMRLAQDLSVAELGAVGEKTLENKLDEMSKPEENETNPWEDL